jgi:hypothetical protein
MVGQIKNNSENDKIDTSEKRISEKSFQLILEKDSHQARGNATDHDRETQFAVNQFIGISAGGHKGKQDIPPVLGKKAEDCQRCTRVKGYIKGQGIGTLPLKQLMHEQQVS